MSEHLIEACSKLFKLRDNLMAGIEPNVRKNSQSSRCCPPPPAGTQIVAVHLDYPDTNEIAQAIAKEVSSEPSRELHARPPAKLPDVPFTRIRLGRREFDI